MTDSNRDVTYAQILNNYSIQPYFVEDYGKVHKVYANKGTFALKTILPQQGTDFIRHVHYLYQKGFNRIVPVYPTMDGRYAVLDENHLYYLMPWLPNEEKENRNERHQQLFRELARLHTLSAREITVKKEDRTEHHEKTLQQLDKNQELLDGFIEDCEKKSYMSPFELLFSLYYHEISQALKFSKTKFEEWFESTKDQEKARMVVIHGKVSTEHFLYDEKGYGYFINFENARYGSPIHDILPFLSRTLKTQPKQNEDAIDWIQHYLKYFPYKKDEKLLLLSYLAHPLPIIQVVENYLQKKRNANELKFIRQLQKQFWLLKNTEYIVMRLSEIDSQQQVNEEGAQQ
ncbi:MAG: spore coat protein YsxE [Bacillota bacterium]|nr:spore coat protein YsxE [Bacillota bacterium]